MSGRWWHENRWGLLLFVPAIAIAMILPIKNYFDGAWNQQPHVAVSAVPGEWVSFAGARIRLVKLAPTTLKDSLGKTFALPSGVRAWEVVLAISTSDKKSLGGCQIGLQTASGAIYAAGPSELIEADLPILDCAPDDGGNDYDVTAYFLLPTKEQPGPVRFMLSTQLPHFALIR